MPKLELGKYQHYRGKLYEVIAVGRLEKTLEEVVVYQTLYDSPDFPLGSVWVRPVKEFIEQVDSNGQKIPRFSKI